MKKKLTWLEKLDAQKQENTVLDLLVKPAFLLAIFVIVAEIVFPLFPL